MITIIRCFSNTTMFCPPLPAAMESSHSPAGAAKRDCHHWNPYPCLPLSDCSGGRSICLRGDAATHCSGMIWRPCHRPPFRYSEPIFARSRGRNRSPDAVGIRERLTPLKPRGHCERVPYHNARLLRGRKIRVGGKEVENGLFDRSDRSRSDRHANERRRNALTDGPDVVQRLRG